MVYTKKSKKANKSIDYKANSLVEEPVILEASLECITFQVGDYVIYPSHGLGKIVNEEKITLGGIEREFYVVSITDDKMLLKIPKNCNKSGLRHLNTVEGIDIALMILGQKASTIKKLWNKRSAGYLDKIHTGKLEEIAKVLRDLHRTDNNIRSFSERAIYELAMQRFIAEYSVVKSIQYSTAEAKIRTILNCRDDDAISNIFNDSE